MTSPINPFICTCNILFHPAWHSLILLLCDINIANGCCSPNLTTAFTTSSRAQEIFRGALQTDEIRLRLQGPSAASPSAASPSSSPKPPPSYNNVTKPQPPRQPNFLFKSPPPPPPARSPSTQLSPQKPEMSLPPTPPQPEISAPATQAKIEKPLSPSADASQSLMQSNTRKLGKKIVIELTKGVVSIHYTLYPLPCLLSLLLD